MLVDIQNKREEKIFYVLIWKERFENWILHYFAKLTIVSIWKFLIFIKFYTNISVQLLFKRQGIRKVWMNLVAYLIIYTWFVLHLIFTIDLLKFTVSQLSKWVLCIFQIRGLLIVWILLVKCLKRINLFLLVYSC